MSRRAQNASGSPREFDREKDLGLAHAAVAGSLPAWHELVDRFTGMIYGVVRRHLFCEDEDDVRSVHADILGALYHGGLASYEGRSSLATWIVVFSRNRARDFLRRRHGRLRPPRWLERLTPLQRDLVRLYFVERLPLEILIHQVRLVGHDVSHAEILEEVFALSDVVPEEYLQRAAAGPLRQEDLEAHSPALLARLRVLGMEADGTDSAPDASLVAAEEAELLERLRQAVAQLSRPERRVLHLRFRYGWTASRIARDMGLEGPRRVYTITESALAKLRAALDLGNRES